MRHRCRQPRPLTTFASERAEVNARLRELHTDLHDEEFIGARLCTPACGLNGRRAALRRADSARCAPSRPIAE